MRLHLVRHPKTPLAADICYGASDIQVGPEVLLAAAVQLGATLPRRVPIIASPLRRCAELADILAPLLDAPAVTHDQRLKEMDFGAWEMQSWNDIPRREIDAWAADLANYRPGGAESVLDAATRVHAWRQDLQRRDDAELIVVCHAGTIRLLLAAQAGLPLSEAAIKAAQVPHAIGHGEAVILDLATPQWTPR